MHATCVRTYANMRASVESRHRLLLRLLPLGRSCCNCMFIRRDVCTCPCARVRACLIWYKRRRTAYCSLHLIISNMLLLCPRVVLEGHARVFVDLLHLPCVTPAFRAFAVDRPVCSACAFLPCFSLPAPLCIGEAGH